MICLIRKRNLIFFFSTYITTSPFSTKLFLFFFFPKKKKTPAIVFEKKYDILGRADTNLGRRTSHSTHSSWAMVTPMVEES